MIDEKMRKKSLGMVWQRAINATVEKSEYESKELKKFRRPPNIRLTEMVKNDILIKEMIKSAILNVIE